jgi:hypothetical protein
MDLPGPGHPEVSSEILAPWSSPTPVAEGVLALMPWVIPSAHFAVIERVTDCRSHLLLQPPQGRGFGMSVRLRSLSLRPSRMIQGPGFEFGPDALGHGD